MREKGKPLAYVVLTLAAVIFAFPFVWMVNSSLMSTPETMTIPVTLIPAELQWENYSFILERFPVWRWYINSITVMIGMVAGQIIFPSLAAFAFARLNFRGKDIVFILFLSLMMVPEQIFIMPRYYLLQGFGLDNSLIALFLPKIWSVFAVFMLRQFFMGLPKELDEAAKIDGCGYFTIYSRILMPLLKGPLVSLAILAGLAAWKDLLWPIIMIRENELKTVIAGLAVVQDAYGSQFNYTMVAGVLGSFAIIIVFFLLQKQIVRGIAQEGIKG